MAGQKEWLEDREIHKWDRLPACHAWIDRLEAYPTLKVRRPGALGLLLTNSSEKLEIWT